MRFILLILTVLLAGCVSLKTPKQSPEHFRTLSAPVRQKSLGRLQRWSIQGAFSIVEKGHKPVLANYSWLQRGKTYYKIQINSALDLFAITLTGGPHIVTLWRSARDHVSAKTPEALLYAQMGWRIPIRNLVYWVRGMTAPGTKQVKHDQYGHVIVLHQKGWVIRYFSYHGVKGFDLPSKILLNRPGLSITLVIKKWRLIGV